MLKLGTGLRKSGLGLAVALRTELNCENSLEQLDRRERLENYEQGCWFTLCTLILIHVYKFAHIFSLLSRLSVFKVPGYEGSKTLYANTQATT